MLNRRLLVYVGGAVAVAAVELLVVEGWRIATGRHVYGQLRVGMTRAEARAAIGSPPGIYDHRRPYALSGAPPAHLVCESGIPLHELPEEMRTCHPDNPTLVIWVWDNYAIWLAVDGNGLVVGKYLLAADDW